MNNLEFNDVIIKDNKLILSDNLLLLLSAKTNDRINIGYIDIKGTIYPIININENGNILNKNKSVSFRGKQKELLEQFGSVFKVLKQNDLLILEGNGLPIFSNVDKAIDNYITKQIILDNNFNITKLNNYEF